MAEDLQEIWLDDPGWPVSGLPWTVFLLLLAIRLLIVDLLWVAPTTFLSDLSGFVIFPLRCGNLWRTTQAHRSRCFHLGLWRTSLSLRSTVMPTYFAVCWKNLVESYFPPENHGLCLLSANWYVCVNSFVVNCGMSATNICFSVTYTMASTRKTPCAKGFMFSTTATAPFLRQSCVQVAWTRLGLAYWTVANCAWTGRIIFFSVATACTFGLMISSCILEKKHNQLMGRKFCRSVVSLVITTAWVQHLKNTLNGRAAFRT